MKEELNKYIEKACGVTKKKKKTDWIIEETLYTETHPG